MARIAAIHDAHYGSGMSHGTSECVKCQNLEIQIVGPLKKSILKSVCVTMGLRSQITGRWINQSESEDTPRLVSPVLHG